MFNHLFITVLFAISFSVANAAKIPLFIGSGTEEGVSYALLDSETGELSGLRNIAKTSAPGSLAWKKDGQILFSTGRVKGEETGFVASYSWQADGTMTQLSKQSSMGAGPCHISLDKDSKFLFVANYSGGSVASYAIKESGELSPAVSHYQHEGSSVHPKRQTRAHAHSIYTSPDNQFVYAADLGTDQVMIYKLDSSTGKLTPSGSAKVPAGGGARHMVFSDKGDKLYVLNELNITVSRFARDAKTGALTLETTKPVMADSGDTMSCSEITLSADGKFLYAACRDLENKKRDVISVLNVADLSIIQEQATGVWIPRHFNISPSGKWLVIAGMRDNKVVVFSRDQKTGKLAETPHSVEVEKPMWILFP